MERATLPLARKDDLRIQTVAEETLVYDDTTDRAYVLSSSAAAVWRACNGRRSAQEIADYLSRETPTNEQTVQYALSQLGPLLVETVVEPDPFKGISRRQFLKRTGLVAGAVAVPIVVSIVAPQPAHAQSASSFCCLCVGGQLTIVSNCEQCDEFCAVDASTTVASCTLQTTPGACFV